MIYKGCDICSEGTNDALLFSKSLLVYFAYGILFFRNVVCASEVGFFH